MWKHVEDGRSIVFFLTKLVIMYLKDLQLLKFVELIDVGDRRDSVAVKCEEIDLMARCQLGEIFTSQPK